MKRIFTLLFLTSFCFASNAQKLVLIEEFTQASCPPCEATTPLLEQTLTANEDVVVQIRYQTSWPGVDPMNADNPGEVQSRVDYYGVSGVPNLKINGGEATGDVFPATSNLVFTEQIQEEAAKTAAVSMTVEHTLSEDRSMTDIIVKVTNDGTEVYNLASDKLRVAGIEEVINWATPPGSTSIVDFEAVMKTFYTTPAGIDVPAIEAGETWEMTWSVAVPNTVYNITKFNIIGFIQDDSNKAVINAGKSEPAVVTGVADGGISSSTAAQTGNTICEAVNITPIANLSNEYSEDITSAEIMMTLGATTQIQTFEGMLTEGQSVEVVFDEIAVPYGSNILSFSILSVNGETSDISSVNNLASGGVYGSFSPVSVGITLEDGFENQLGLPSNTVIDFPITEGFGTGSFTLANAGAYGESASSVWVNFYQWNPAEANAAANGSMTFQKIDLTGYSQATISFDRAHAGYLGSSDELQVLASTDCGVTYEMVYTKSGAALKTAGDSETLFIPTANQWATDEIDFSAFAGMDEVMVQFRAVSGWGNSLFLDNVSVSGILTGTQEIENVDLFELTPNPATEFLNIDFKLADNESYTLTLLDFSGKAISTIVSGAQSQTTQTLDISNLAVGMYFVQAATAEGIKIQKFIKQ